jgi:parvulin-like peptidyl-prolyl isomerase
MEPKKMPLGSKTPRLLAGALLVCTTFGAGYALQARRQPAVMMVAIVNGAPVTADDVDVRLSDILPFASYHGSVDGGRLTALRRTALDDVVLDALIYDEAVREGRHPDSKTVDEAIDEVRGRFPSRVEFERAMSEAGLTERDVRERHERADIVRAAKAAHEPRPVTDTDIAAYYEANAAKFERPEQRHVIELLVRVDPADPSSEGPARRKAESLAAQAKRGGDLRVLARRQSEDEYRVKDGDLGFVHRGRMDEELEAAMFTAPPGKISVARGFRGFSVFEVIESEPKRLLTLDEARPIIRERMNRQRKEAAIAAWYTRLRSSAQVEILDAALRAAKPAEVPRPATFGRASATVVPNGGGE